MPEISPPHELSRAELIRAAFGMLRDQRQAVAIVASSALEQLAAGDLASLKKSLNLLADAPAERGTHVH